MNFQIFQDQIKNKFCNLNIVERSQMKKENLAVQKMEINL